MKKSNNENKNITDIIYRIENGLIAASKLKQRFGWETAF